MTFVAEGRGEDGASGGFFLEGDIVALLGFRRVDPWVGAGSGETGAAPGGLYALEVPVFLKAGVGGCTPFLSCG